MTSAQRTQLIGRAKSLAVPVASCVAARVPPDHLLQARTWDELAALVIVLAEAADPLRLRAVTASHEDGDPRLSVDVLREAHRIHSQLRQAGVEVPPRIAGLERMYQRWRKQEQRQDQQQAEAAA